MAMVSSRAVIRPNSAAQPRPPMMAPIGMKVKNTSMPLYPSTLVVLKISIHASPAPMPSVAPPTAPNTRPSKANSAIFMKLDPETEAGPLFGRSNALKGSTTACVKSAGPASVLLYVLLCSGGDLRDEILLHHLLDKIKRVDDFSNLDDLAVAKRKEAGDVKLHDPFVEPFGEESAKMHRDLVVFGGDERYLVAHARIALMNGLPHLPDVVLAAVVAEMRQDIDRRVGENVDIIAAKRQRPFDISSVKCLDQFDDTQFVEVFGHSLLRRRQHPTRQSISPFFM